VKPKTNLNSLRFLCPKNKPVLFGKDWSFPRKGLEFPSERTGISSGQNFDLPPRSVHAKHQQKTETNKKFSQPHRGFYFILRYTNESSLAKGIQQTHFYYYTQKQG
jgi:hypothetical protein